jgi:hypothetical protein
VKIAILTDVHANLPALEAALEAIRRESCDTILVTPRRPIWTAYLRPMKAISFSMVTITRRQTWPATIAENGRYQLSKHIALYMPPVTFHADSALAPGHGIIRPDQ